MELRKDFPIIPFDYPFTNFFITVVERLGEKLQCIAESGGPEYKNADQNDTPLKCMSYKDASLHREHF